MWVIVAAVVMLVGLELPGQRHQAGQGHPLGGPGPARPPA